ncbi:MAG: class I SAM-dependent methyltransferase, partial [Acidimicrobiales bacterium]
MTTDRSVAGDTPPATNWDELAPWWRETFSNGADVEYELQILPLAESGLEGCHRILDVGTGEGQLARRLASAYPDCLVVGIDPSSAQVGNAREQGGGPVYLQGRGEFLPFAARSFDGVVCCLVIEHVDDPDSVLVEMARLV